MITSEEVYTSDEEISLLTKKREALEVATKKKYPKAVFFIIGNEFCERFSYYGMRTILTIYLTQVLLYSDNAATIIYHVFTMAAYFTPLLGAIIADSWLGKYKTILYISIIYALGNVTISIGSFPNSLFIMSTASLLGLAIIAIGTGGIKPCVSAFGGDQFEVGQEEELKKFFSLFYLSINMGSVISTFLTPILREEVHCFGQKSCFPLAFGVPAILMIIALILFLMGRRLYKIVPPKGNIVVKVFQCIGHALVNKTRSKEKKKSHWLDYAEDRYGLKFINDIKTVLHVLCLCLPLPLFWALFDQQGSRWTLQATRMNGEFFGYHIKPDQIQVINPFLIIVFIPLFEYIIYPIFAKCHLLKKPLQRMTTGGLLAAVAFVIAGFVEISLEKTYPVLPAPGSSELNIINNSPCKIEIKEADIGIINAFDKKIVMDLPLDEKFSLTFTPINCPFTNDPLTKEFNSTSIIESMMITIDDNHLTVIKIEDSKTKPESGEPKVRIFFNTHYKFQYRNNASFLLSNKENSKSLIPEILEDSNIGVTDYINIPPGISKIYLPFNETSPEEDHVGQIKVRAGGAYIVSIYENREQLINVSVNIYTIVEPNTVHMLFQVPQYVIITAGEIMFSITGLEFCYSQAPISMKSVLQAAWLLTVAFGSLIVVIIAELDLFEKRSYEFFMYACLMGLDMLVFAVMAYFYKYVTINDNQEDDTPSKGKDNKGFEDETDFTK